MPDITRPTRHLIVEGAPVLWSTAGAEDRRQTAPRSPVTCSCTNPKDFSGRLDEIEQY